MRKVSTAFSIAPLERLGYQAQACRDGVEAVEFYEKVFSLDINFEDVTERLRALR